jgi:hypothetical protein
MMCSSSGAHNAAYTYGDTYLHLYYQFVGSTETTLAVV